MWIRKRQCGRCGLNFRTTYRGKRPLCKACRAFGNDAQQKISLVKLPSDVLHCLVPYFLLCAGPQDRDPKFRKGCPFWLSPRVTFDDVVEPNDRFYPAIIERAWMPLLRIKLICKDLHDATNAYLKSLLVPFNRCNEAATLIQRAWFNFCLVTINLNGYTTRPT